MIEEPRISLYFRLCKALGKVKDDPSKARNLKSKARLLREQINTEKRNARLFQLQGTEKEYEASLSRLHDLETKLSKLEKVIEQRAFKKAMRITGLNLEVDEVVRFGTVMAIISLFPSLLIAFLATSLVGLDTFTVALACTGACITIPLAVFLFIVNYPESLAKRLELESFGSAPEMVNYMAMSMELTPSLDRALQFAAENSTGPMARELEALVWRIQTREYPSTEKALATYAMELEGENEELRSAIYNLLSAAKESDPESMGSNLQRATAMIMTGTRHRVEEYSASLSTPATVLFALGILLPMVLGSLIPMMSFGGFDSGSQSNSSWSTTFVLSFLLMDLIFPTIALLYSRNILSRRPGIYSFLIPDNASDIFPRLPVFIAAVCITTILSWLTFTGTGFWGHQESISVLLFIVGISISLWYLIRTAGSRKSRLRELEGLENQMPDMLFQIGSRMAEGLAIERALEEVGQSMDGTQAGDFLLGLVNGLGRSGRGLEEYLFSDDGGIMPPHPSRKLKATMRLMVEASKKNPETAGKLLMSMSNHMRELSKTDRELKVKMRATIDSMRNTALFFAPVIMGVTVGLYHLLNSTFEEMQGQEGMPDFLFVSVMGTYLLLTVAIIIVFCSGIEKGRSRWREDLAFSLPVSAMIFSISSLGALLAFG